MLLRIAFAFLALLSAQLMVSPGHADSSTTWYVAANGSGTNCSQTVPCSDLATALGVAAAGDTIVCLSQPVPHSLNIIISITIDCSSARAPFAGGGFLPSADSSHVQVLINVPGGDVRLRGLTINNPVVFPSPSDRGIDIQAAAAVYVEDSVISNFAKQGIYDHRTGGQTKLYVKDTVVSGNAGAGIVAVSATGMTVLDNVTSEKNTYGIAVGTGNNVAIRNSAFFGNSAAGVEGDPGSHVVVSNSTISHNNVGVQSTSSVRIKNNDISFNNTAFSGLAATLGLNSYNQNVSIGTTPSVVPGAPSDIGP